MTPPTSSCHPSSCTVNVQPWPGNGCSWRHTRFWPDGRADFMALPHAKSRRCHSSPATPCGDGGKLPLHHRRAIDPLFSAQLRDCRLCLWQGSSRLKLLDHQDDACPQMLRCRSTSISQVHQHLPPAYYSQSLPDPLSTCLISHCLGKWGERI